MSIECYHMEKAYKNKALFKGLSVAFQKGLCHCIMGENGSGKTTFLRMLAGLEKLDQGSIRIRGTCTYSGSNPYMLRGTVRENLEFPFKLKRQFHKKNQARVEAMLESLGLKDLENQEATTLSSGERQKLALGRALVWEPDILLLDEPTANIDQGTIESIEKILRAYVKQSNHTLLLVSHDYDQGRRLGAKNWLLKDQKLWEKEGDIQWPI